MAKLMIVSGVAASGKTFWVHKYFPSAFYMTGGASYSVQLEKWAGEKTIVIDDIGPLPPKEWFFGGAKLGDKTIIPEQWVLIVQDEKHQLPREIRCNAKDHVHMDHHKAYCVNGAGV